MNFKRVLIANRGEIACRILRTVHRLGYRSVAVYSDADAMAMHVRDADTALRIGPAPASDSYLNIAALLDAARRSGADAVHPGYGFLSERADFAQACIDAGLVFIGPPPEAMRAMGDKASAKHRMLDAGVPCVPGFMAEPADDAALIAAAAELGAPLLVKAVAGGGGRGMRLVQDLATLPQALVGARREAQSSFGDAALMLERLIVDARHVEVQIFADAHGRCVHLGERDCTAQRRRQKLIEESPSPIADEALRARLCHDAIAAALAVGYQGAGTVEFIVDADRRHYFLEMNTRLQVEHAVTEAVTGLDLVEWQLRIASGEPLPLRQDQIRFEGHAIEARLVSEDPYDEWTPQTGEVLSWRPQDSALRIDHGIQAGDPISPHYDAMVAKFIAHGHDRVDASRRLVRALADAPMFGPRNNARFLHDLLQHKTFISAQMTTTLIDDWARTDDAMLRRPTAPETAWRIAAAVRGGSAGTGLAFDLSLSCDGIVRQLRCPADGVAVESFTDGWLTVTVDGVRQRLPAVMNGDTLLLAIDATVHRFTEPSPWPAAGNAGDGSQVRAATAGVVAEVRVQVGDRVDAGQSLACVEAMKMEMWVHATVAGTIVAVHCAPKQSIAAGALLIELEPTE